MSFPLLWVNTTTPSQPARRLIAEAGEPFECRRTTGSSGFSAWNASHSARAIARSPRRNAASAADQRSIAAAGDRAGRA